MVLKTSEVLPVNHVEASAEFKRTVYHVTIPRKFTWENCLVPEFWRNVNQLKAHDLLEIEAESGEFDALARVTAADKGFAVLRVLRLWKAPAEAIQGESASVGFILGKGWTLFDFDGAPIATFVDEEQAKVALADYIEHNKREEVKENA